MSSEQMAAGVLAPETALSATIAKALAAEAHGERSAMISGAERCIIDTAR
jgi:hypothetical protein